MKKKYKFALLGHPIGHSLSPEIHKIFAEGAGIDVSYEKIDVEKDAISIAVSRMKNEGYNGFNCTMPLKSEILHYTDYKTRQCEIMDTCNTVKINDGILYSHTTDGEGIRHALLYNGAKIKNKNILILGASATARSALYSLISEGPKSITIYNRGEENLNAAKNIAYAVMDEKLATNVKTELNFKLFNGEFEQVGDTDIFINATNLGMNGFDEHSNFNFLVRLKKDCIIFDAVYNPLKTNLLKNAEKSNFQIIDGFWMLIFQGAAAFEIWTGEKISGECIEKAHEIVLK